MSALQNVPKHSTVSSLLDSVKATVERSLPTNIWVKGEIKGYSFYAGSGNHFFELIEHPQNRKPCKISCTIFSNKWPLIQQKLKQADLRLVDGQELLVEGKVTLHHEQGKLS